MRSSREEYWSGLPFPFPGDLPNPKIELGSPALQADSLPSQPPGKPINARSRTQIPGSLAPEAVLKHPIAKNAPAMQETPVRFLGGKGPLEKGQATHSWSEYSWAFLVAQMVKNSPAIWKTWVHPGVGKIPWRTAWQPTPVFLPGESPWAEEPGGYSPGGHEELDTTERLSTAQYILLSPVLSSS